MTKPLVSIVISIFNGETYARQAIESALDQTYPRKEILVVNDGSTDRTAEILSSIESKIIRIDQKNRGLGASRNAAIQIAKGDYFAFLDHDDYWPEHKLSVQMEALLASPSDPLVFGHVQQFLCPSLTQEEKDKLLVPSSILPAQLAGTLLISRSRLEEIGPFLEERKQLGEFMEWYSRVIEKKIPTLMLPDLFLYRRIHQNNMGRKEQNRRTDYLRILKSSLDRRRTCP